MQKSVMLKDIKACGGEKGPARAEGSWAARQRRTLYEWEPVLSGIKGTDEYRRGSPGTLVANCVQFLAGWLSCVCLPWHDRSSV